MQAFAGDKRCVPLINWTWVCLWARARATSRRFKEICIPFESPWKGQNAAINGVHSLRYHKYNATETKRFRAFTLRAQQWIPLNCDVRARYHLTVESSTRFSAANLQQKKKTKKHRDRIRGCKKRNWYKKRREHFHNSKLFFFPGFGFGSAILLYFIVAQLNFIVLEKKKTLKSKRKYAHFVR